MIEVTGFIPPTPEAEPGLLVRKITEANTYKTREIKRLTVNGVMTDWHLLKGGMKPTESSSTEPADKTIKYEVLFDPITRTWLKAMPTEGIGSSQFETFEQRLRKSALQQQVALTLSGLPDLARQIKQVEVERDGETVYGYTTPHIGPSLEHFVYTATGKRRSNELPPNMVNLVSDVYSIAADQAEKLYLQFGIWTPDPNPGNILLRPDENGVHVVLIDFSNSHQEHENIFPHVPLAKYPSEKYVDKVKSLLSGNVRQLHQKFAVHTGIHGAPFVRDPGEMAQNLERSVAVINARRLIAQPQEALH